MVGSYEPVSRKHSRRFVILVCRQQAISDVNCDQAIVLRECGTNDSYRMTVIDHGE